MYVETRISNEPRLVYACVYLQNIFCAGVYMLNRPDLNSWDDDFWMTSISGISPDVAILICTYYSLHIQFFAFDIVEKYAAIATCPVFEWIILLSQIFSMNWLIHKTCPNDLFQNTAKLVLNFKSHQYPICE